MSRSCRNKNCNAKLYTIGENTCFLEPQMIILNESKLKYYAKVYIFTIIIIIDLQFKCHSVLETIHIT